MKKTPLVTDRAPKAIGPYSQGMMVQANRLAFLSGQIALDPQAPTPTIVGKNVDEQTRQVMKNIQGLLQSIQADFKQIVKTTIFLRDMADFPTVNEIYGSYFPAEPPARSTVAVSGLPMGVLVEIECIVALE